MKTLDLFLEQVESELINLSEQDKEELYHAYSNYGLDCMLYPYNSPLRSSKPDSAIDELLEFFYSVNSIVHNLFGEDHDNPED